MSSAEAGLNLCRAFEARLLAVPPPPAGRLPAVVLSGFLGSGKTTVLAALLRSRANLRFAVLMNELAGFDVDSGLLGNANAVLGLPLLSIPDACACCTGAEALRAALKRVLALSGEVDAIIIELTGVADPAPLAAVLASVGVSLECVAVVVDADAALSQLAGLAAPTLTAQLGCADLVILNKCDLADQAALAATEDAVALLSPARITRCRHGDVPISLLLNVRLIATPAAPPEGILSHERSSGHVARFERVEAEGRRMRRRVEPVVRAAHSLTLISSVAWTQASPLCAAAFAAWLLDAAGSARGLLRAKGQLFLAQRRARRHIFHFSGAGRVEGRDEGGWEGTPGSTIVLIGSDRTELQRLRGLLDQLATCSASDAATAFAARVCKDARFEDLPAVAVHERDVPGMVDLSLKGHPLRGIDSAALNGALMRVAAADQAPLLLWGVTAQKPGGAARLRLAFPVSDSAWETLSRAADAVLRDAFAHVGLCAC